MNPAKTVRSAPQCFIPACGSVFAGAFGLALGFGLAFGFAFAVDLALALAFTVDFDFAFAVVTDFDFGVVVSFAAAGAPCPIAAWSTSVAGAADGAAGAWSA